MTDWRAKEEDEYKMSEKKDFVVFGLRESKGKEIINLIFCLVDILTGTEK